MPQKLLKVITVTIFLSSLISCQKEISADTGNPPPTPTTADSIYLDKIYILNSNAIPIDSALFVYDNLHRVISMGFNSPATYVNNYTYFYNGSDTTPFRSEQVYFDQSVRDTINTYFLYGANNISLRDSFIESRWYITPPAPHLLVTEVTGYTYSANKKYAHTDLLWAGSPPVSSVRTDTAVLDAAGNVLSSKANYSTTTAYNTSVLTYDTHVNPFSLLSNFKAHQRLPSGETLFFEYFSYNNILLKKEENPNPFMIPTTYTYTYKANGLPEYVTAVINATDTTRLKYTYRKF